MLTVLEMALRELLARAGAPAPALGPSGDVPEAMREGLRALHDELAGERLRGELARLVVAEEQAYRRGARTSYFADSLAVDVLTDTTERSPTFCTPSFRKWDDAEASESWAFLFTPRRHDRGGLDAAPPTGPADDRVDGGRPPGAPRRGGRGEAGRDPAGDRPARADAVPHRPRRSRSPAGARRRRVHDRGGGERPPADGGRGRIRGRAGAVTGGGGLRRRDRRGPAGGARAPHRGARGERERRVDGRADRPRHPVPPRPAGSHRRQDGPERALDLHHGPPRAGAGEPDDLPGPQQPEADRPLDPLHSRPRPASPYEDACRALFEVIEYVEPRRSAGKTYPAPVGVATMRLRHGLGFPEAEARLVEELG